MTRNRIGFLLLACLFAGGVAQAQDTTGRLIGTVKDEQGGALPGVTVTATSPALIGGPRITQTDADGTFTFPDLAPGRYTVRFELEGFVPQEVADAQVRLDRATEVQAQLASGQFTEQVTVTAEVPVLDPTQSAQAETYSEEYLSTAPVGSSGRSYQSVVSTTAGAVDVEGTGNPSVFGSTDNENAYFIDGIDTTDPVTATFGTNFNFDAIQEISFQTAGFEAEYGRATGGIINLITKSGGNEFSGTFDVRYSDDQFAEGGDHFDPDQQQSSAVQPSATLGGPISRDRAWFFASAENIRTRTTPFQSTDTRAFDGQNYIGKVTWQAAENWRVVVKGSADPAEIENANADVLVRPEATSFQEQGGSIYQGEVSGIFTPELLWDLRLGRNRQELNAFPSSRNLDLASHTDNATNVLSGNYDNAQFSNRDRDDYRTSLTYLRGNLAGDHEFKGGLEYGDLRFKSENFTPSGFAYTDLNGQPFVLTVSNRPGPSEATGALRTAYLQDAWRPIPRLTLNLGVRYDQVDYRNDAGTEIADMDKVQPRLGFAWDLAGDARTVLRGSWGRFMHPNALTLPNIARINQVRSDTYVSCTAFFGDRDSCIAANGAENVIDDPEGFDPAGYFFFSSFASLPSTIVPDLQPTFADETLVGVERQLGPRTSVDLSYVRKRTRDIFEDTCRGNLPTPNAGAVCDFYTVANLPGLRRDYDGYLLQFRSRATEWLNLRASYTYADSKGSIENTQNAGIDFDIFPDHFVNTYGYLSDQRRHRVRLNGFVRLPWDTSLSVDALYGSPFRWAPIMNANAQTSYGTIFVEPRGSREGAERYRLDLQLAKGLTIRGVRAQLIGSVFNVLDDEQVTEVCEQVEGCAGSPLGAATDFTQPRNYEVGFRLEF